MRVPVSLLRAMAPVRDEHGPVSVDTLATVMNARVSEVEWIHRFPNRQALRGFRLGPMEADGRLVLDPLGAPATEASLGIGDDSSQPLRLSPELPADVDLFDALELDDAILEFDLEPNRPDLFSLAGMARDAAAIWRSSLNLPAAAEIEPVGVSSVRLAVHAAERVPRYVAVEVDGVVVGPSPQWLQNAVRKLGMRPINNVVDATNLVMLELGEPMHTFDRRQIQSGVIGLRLARPGEKMTTLDGVERELTDECLLVVDGDPTQGEGGQPVALAGIMGSQGSGIQPDTTSVLIEAACFDMATVRRASRRLSLRTEASLRFEKGLPAHGVGPAVRRLVDLMRQVCGPALRVVGHAEHWPAPPAARTLQLDPARLRHRLAMELSDQQIDELLGMSSCRVERRQSHGAESGHWRVELPFHRPDLAIPEDLEEEVGRLHGYEAVRSEDPLARTSPVPGNPLFVLAARTREVLLAWGLDEVYLSTWLSDAELQTFELPQPGDGSPLVELSNPLNVELRYFRPSAIPAVLGAVAENTKLFDAFGLFEIGRIYARGADCAIVETPTLTGAIVDQASAERGGPVYRARDLLLDLGKRLGLVLELGQAPLRDLPDWTGARLLHPGRNGLLRTKDGHLAAVFGELHPRRARNLGLRGAPTLFAVDLQVVFDRAGSHQPRFQPPPRFPSVEAHVNVLAPRRLLAAELLGRIEAPDLVRRTVRDVWEGAGVPAGQRRLTLELEFNRADGSLTHEEIAQRLHGVQQALQTDPDIQVELPRG